MTNEQKRILELADLLRDTDCWTAYSTVGEIVYGPGRGAQTVGNTMRAFGTAKSAHRILSVGGKVSDHFRGDAGSPNAAIRRLRAERLWDESRNSARPDRYIDAQELRRLQNERRPKNLPG